jgi:hypothetical protein
MTFRQQTNLVTKVWILFGGGENSLGSEYKKVSVTVYGKISVLTLCNEKRTKMTINYIVVDSYINQIQFQ